MSRWAANPTDDPVPDPPPIGRREFDARRRQGRNYQIIERRSTSGPRAGLQLLCRGDDDV
jgi:hypothetical protein